MAATRRQGRAWVPILAVASGWAASRLLFRWGLGIDFDASPLDWFWQYVDPPLLRADPWTSVFYHHAQPPLWNLYLAAALWLGGDEPHALLDAGQLAMGLALHLGLYALMRRLGVRTWVAVGASLVFAFSPESILYESWLFYPIALAAMLVGAAWALHRLVERGARVADAAVFFVLIATAVLTRSLFHLAWMFAVVAGTGWALRPHAARLALVAMLPVLLAASVYAKNLAVFGQFTSSTWLGMNLARVVVSPIPERERAQLVREGRLGEVSLVPPFSSLEEYPLVLRTVSLHAAHPVLDEPVKSGGSVNYNHLAYIEISRRYLRDALSRIAADPLDYASSVMDAWLIFAWSPTEYRFLDGRRARIAGWDRFWKAFVYGVPAAWVESIGPSARPSPQAERRFLLRYVGFLFAFASCAALGYAAWRGYRELRAADGDRALGVTLLFIVATVLWVAVVGNAAELRENNRFRFMVDPLLFSLLVLGGERAIGRRASRPVPGVRGRIHGC